MTGKVVENGTVETIGCVNDSRIASPLYESTGKISSKLFKQQAVSPSEGVSDGLVVSVFVF
ncbi:MAG: hypothetical protein OXI43_02370 [Candidatus Poribacteria bacterium]|nr:hypothetical protein [Candidatus Poribacteria bacterium]